MTCEGYRPLLSLYYDGLLIGPRSAESEAIRAHLADCPDCSSILAAYRNDEARLTVVLAAAPNPRLRASVLAATVNRDTAGRRATSERARSPRGQIVFGGVAGGSVAVLAVMLLTLMGNLPGRDNRPSRQIAASQQARATALAWVAGVGEPSTISLAPGSGAQAHAGPTVSHPGPVLADSSPRASSPLIATSFSTRAPLDRAATIRMVPEAVLTKGAIRGPLWSPDSTSLLYLTHWAVDQATGWYAGTLMRYGPSGTVQLATEVRDFDWSPDGRSVAYTTETRRAGDSLGSTAEAYLHVVGADGAGDRLLVSVDRTNVEWFADGIVAVQRGRVVRVQPNTGEVTLLSGIPTVKVADEASGFSALSANERFFAYQDGTGLHVWDRTRAGAPIVVQPNARYMAAGFHFSWDGGTIFYSVFEGKRAVLYRQTLAPLGQPIALDHGLSLHGPIDLVGPTSADGAVLGFRTGTGSNTRNYLIDTRTGTAHSVLPPGGVGPLGWWSPNGRHVVYVLYQGDKAIRAGIAGVRG